MPVVTRSSTTGPNRKMISGKRKYDEISYESDSDSEYSDDSIEEIVDEIEDLKEELQESRDSENAIIDALVREREKTRELEAQLSEMTENYNHMVDVVADMKKDALCESVFYTATILMSVITLFASVSICSDYSLI